MIFESIQARVGEGIEIFRGAVELFLSNVILLVVNALFDAHASALAASLILTCVFQEALQPKSALRPLVLRENPFTSPGRPIRKKSAAILRSPSFIRLSASIHRFSVFCICLLQPIIRQIFRCPNRAPIHVEYSFTSTSHPLVHI